jgi:hypothetical protein
MVEDKLFSLFLAVGKLRENYQRGVLERILAERIAKLIQNGSKAQDTSELDRQDQSNEPNCQACDY